MRLRRQAFALVTSAAVFAASAAAFGQQKPEEPKPGEPKPAEPKPGEPKPEKSIVRLLPKEGGWQISELFDQIHRTTGISILFDGTNATFKQAKVEFVGVHSIDVDDLFDWLQAVLSYRKLVLVPVGPKGADGKQQWFVMDQADPNLKSRPVYIAEDAIEKYADRDGLYVVTTLTLKNINDTTRVRNALSPLSTATAGIGRIQDIPGSRALIVGDFAPVVAAMKRLLSYIDVQNPLIEPRMKLVPLEHAVASELEPILTDLIQSSDQGAQRQPRPQGAPDEEPEPKIIADNRLDALILYATEGPMKKIEALIKELDVPSRARGRLHFRALHHTDAAEMAQLLDDLISNTTSSGGGSIGGTTRPSTSRNSTSRTRNTPTPTGTAPGGGGALSGSAVEGAPVIIADPKSNSLIIQASPTQWETLDDLVYKLDRSRPQVLIETSLVELSLSNQLDVGVELFSTQDNVAIDTNGDGTPDTITNERSVFGNTGFGLSEIISTDVNGVKVPTNKSPIIGQGFTAGIFKNGRLPFILNAFQSSGRARILTQPSLVTNDNEEASITLERKTSFRETVSDNTNTSTNSFKEVTANTELQISPHISSDNYLRLEITQSVSNFGNRPQPDAPPDTITRKVNTNVTLPDTYTVVLGGLIQEEERTSVSKVPILGDIPIIGFFFRQTSDQSNPSHLFLFVTPHILRDTERFSDYHKMSWEKKLLQDDLFQSEVKFPGLKFAGPDIAPTAKSKLRLLEESGELDAGRLKAPLTEAERIKAAEDTLKAAEKEKAKEAAKEKQPEAKPENPPEDKKEPPPPPPAPEDGK
jgi:general secretion pathway protein D